jgi:hypothetical protein
MKPERLLKHEFVEFIPDQLKNGTIYISIPYATVVHKCCCGCGTEVVTPLSPTDWTLVFDGESISLDPSIGNWSFACKSHYWIRRNRVRWAEQWSEERIKLARSHERAAKERYFDDLHSAEEKDTAKSARRFWRRIREWM